MKKRKARANSRMLVKRFFLRERTRHSRKSSRSFNRLMIDAKTARMEKSGRFFRRGWLQWRYGRPSTTGRKSLYDVESHCLLAGGKPAAKKVLTNASLEDTIHSNNKGCDEDGPCGRCRHRDLAVGASQRRVRTAITSEPIPERWY